MKDNWLNTDFCTGCGACVDKCPVKAISMLEDSGCLRPDINHDKCISCNVCKKVCPNFNPISYAQLEERSYIGYFKNRDISKQSSSGGIFIALAKYILTKKDGVVYGAAITYDSNTLTCRHIRICDEKELYRLQGSKYVQSRSDGVYSKVKDDLASGKLVLFSGTSCQIASLRNFVGNQDHLYTVDLVCHGIPKDKLFYDYVSFLEKKYCGCVEDISFRAKDISYHGTPMSYTIKVKINKDNKSSMLKTIVRPQSSFYTLFSNRAGYRESCYHCKYASLQKPADITLGDFLPKPTEVILYGLDAEEHYSSIFVHNQKGQELLNAISNTIWYQEIPMHDILKHHLNLQHPSVMSDKGAYYLSIYKKGGFERLQRRIKVINIKMQIKQQIKSILLKLHK